MIVINTCGGLIYGPPGVELRPGENALTDAQAEATFELPSLAHYFESGTLVLKDPAKPGKKAPPKNEGSA